MSKRHKNNLMRMPLAGLLAWLVPGLGHLYLGYRRRGWVLLIVIAVTFWGGVALGGVAGTVNPRQRTAWFMAQVCAGSHALAALGLSKVVHESPAVYSWSARDVAVVYTGVAGLLNLLVILDALSRAEQPAPVRVSPAERSPGNKGKAT